MRLTDVKKALPATFYGADLMIEQDPDFKKKRRSWYYLWNTAVELGIHWRPSGCAIEMSLTYDLIHMPDTQLVRREPIKEACLLRPLINEVWFEFRDNLRLKQPLRDIYVTRLRLEDLERFLAIPDEYPTLWERLG